MLTVTSYVDELMTNSTFNRFHYASEHSSRILSGEEEGVFAWIAANYLLGRLSNDQRSCITILYTSNDNSLQSRLTEGRRAAPRPRAAGRWENPTLSWHSTMPTPTPTSSPTSSRGSSRGCSCRCRCRGRGIPALADPGRPRAGNIPTPFLPLNSAPLCRGSRLPSNKWFRKSLSHTTSPLFQPFLRRARCCAPNTDRHVDVVTQTTLYMCDVSLAISLIYALRAGRCGA